MNIPIHKKIRYLFRTKYAKYALVVLGLMILALYQSISHIDWPIMKISSTSPTVTGEVVDSEVDASEVGTFEIHFKYKVDGVEYYHTIHFESFSPAPKEKIEVRYLESDPSIATIDGALDGRVYRGWQILALFFSPFMLFLFYFGTIKEREQLRILRNGVVSYGKCIRKKRINDEFEEYPMYSLTFQYELEDGGIMKSKTETYRLQQTTDEEQELLVYHRKKPNKFTLVDDFPDYLIGDIRNAALELKQ